MKYRRWLCDAYTVYVVIDPDISKLFQYNSRIYKKED
jgi:hypothetical protein